MGNNEDVKIDYQVVHAVMGHQENKGVSLVEAAKDIFKKVKEKAMECSIKGSFITFNTIQELEDKLVDASIKGFRIACYDEDHGG